MAQPIPLTIAQQRPTTALPLATEHRPVEHLYIHVPFCFHKCHYCDFYSFVDSRDRQGEFVSRLIDELRTLAPHAGPLRTIFAGGGTPSLLKPGLWRVLLDEIDRLFDLGSLAEFTVECNPETVTDELARTLAAGGVNRVSVGAQSFDERHLKTLERWHQPANVERALRCARDAGVERRSVDLIFAIPGQTLDDWRGDLDRVIGFAEAKLIDHASCYALTYEPNTAMSVRMRRGEFEPTDDDVEAAMYETTVRALGGVGLDRYEVSNFAREDAASQHNLAYWRQRQWLAAGPSASAHVGGHRWKNVPRLTDWMLAIERTGGHSDIVDHEPPDAKRALAERLMLGLRVSDGLDEAALLDEGHATGVRKQLADAIARQRDKAMVEARDAGGRVRLTDRGFLFADGVASELMDACS